MSSINSTGNGLYQYLQQISGNVAAQPSSAAAPTAATGATAATTPSAAPTTSTPVQGAKRQHHGHGQLFKQIQDAVTGALQSAKANGSSDPNKMIEDAISKILKNAGNSSSVGSTGPSATGTDSDGDGDTSGASQTNAAGSSAKQAFFQSLQSVGVDPQQFQNDFLAAIKDAHQGQADPSAAFKNFPTGLTLDTVG